ncbi:MAG: hypothetical protein WHS86_00960 [Desulfosoma sp.]
MEDREEYERRKRAIFEQMSPRGQKRILKLGYENWDPFQEPKDPREQIRSGTAVQAAMILAEFYQAEGQDERLKSHHKELLDLCRGLLRHDPRALAVSAFCCWFERTRSDDR